MHISWIKKIDLFDCFFWFRVTYTKYPTHTHTKTVSFSPSPSLCLSNQQAVSDPVLKVSRWRESIYTLPFLTEEQVTACVEERLCAASSSCCSHTHTHTRTDYQVKVIAFVPICCSRWPFMFSSAVSAVSVCNQDSSLTPSLISSSDLLKAFKSQDRNSLFAQHLGFYWERGSPLRAQNSFWEAHLSKVSPCTF